MRLFKSKAFERFAQKHGITDDDLLAAIKAADQGLIDADLGGGVIKQRIARDGEGKSGGFRSIVYYKSATRSVFVFAFAKKDLANIKNNELRAHRASAKILLKYSDHEMDIAVKHGVFLEVPQRPGKSTETDDGKNEKIQERIAGRRS